ncbi:MAG TPA: hypothetical protein VEQ60_03730 [Longimicrobium sp.]|nr:hypothetical protein [Longimicrobium sp.]
MTRPLLLLAAAVHVLSLTACATTRSAADGRTTLRPFRDDAEIAAFHDRLADERERRLAKSPWFPGALPYLPMPQDPPAGTPSQHEPAVYEQWVIPAAQQTGGDVRETVGMAGEFMVVLRRGWLFTLRAVGDTLHQVSVVDASGLPARLGTAYHELLILGEHVVVIGSSGPFYGTELGIFHVGPDGRLAYRATYFLLTGEHVYHTYAARIVDGRLVLYAPHKAGGHRRNETHRPALHRWTGADSIVHLAPATRVYRPAGRISETDGVELHSVAVCDVAGGELQCEFTGLYAPPGRLHVSHTAVYIWTRQGGGERPASVLYRMPLDGSAPTALRVSGTPMDPSSFMESADGHVHVLVQTDESGTGMWGAGYTAGRLALLRLPLSEMGDGSRAATTERYRPLPAPVGGELKGGYVGNWLIYGSGANLGQRVESTPAVAVRWADGRGLSRLTLPHDLEQVEAMGSGAVLVGSDGVNLHFSTLRLGRDTAVLAHRYTLPGERSSFGAFYRPDAEDVGVLGVLVRGPQRPRTEPWLYGPGGIRFLRNRDLRLEEMGELVAGPFPGDDGCLSSCRNWYGDTRPVFWRGRILVLLGYEMVEAREEAARVREVRRARFAPPLPAANLPGEWAFEEYVGNGQGGSDCRRGTIRVDRDGDSLSVHYRRTGECSADSVRMSSEGEESGEGRVTAMGLAFEVGTCRYWGWMRDPLRLRGEGRCRIAGPDGSTMEVRTVWNAQRPAP